MIKHCVQCGKETRHKNRVIHPELGLYFCNRDCCINWENVRRMYAIVRGNKYYDTYNCLWLDYIEDYNIFTSAREAKQFIKDHGLANEGAYIKNICTRSRKE